MSLIQPVTRTRKTKRVQRTQPRPQATTQAEPVERAMTVSTLGSPFGDGFFSQCEDQIMTLHYAGALPSLDWYNWQVTDVFRREMQYIAYVRPEQSGGADTAGYLSDPCTDPNGIEYGKAELNVEDFGRYGRKGATREILKPKRYCLSDPMYRLDGTPVGSEQEWDLRWATDQILADVSKHLITGNAAVDGQFGGLEYWVKTGYAGANGSILDSNVVNFNSNYMSGGAGMTWNGTAIPTKPGGGYYNLIDILLEAWRRSATRISWSPVLANQIIRLGDVILKCTSQQARLVLDHFTCWSVCEGGQYSPVNLQQREARVFRNNLVSAQNPYNLYGHGYIVLDNTVVPIMVHDPGLVKSATLGDMYLLVGRVGSTRIWEGEHLSAAAVSAEFGRQGGYTSVDGGRIVTQIIFENLCRTLKAWMRPRIFCRAPWMQTRIMNVKGSSAAGILSPDPSSSFYPVTSFTPATVS